MQVLLIILKTSGLSKRFITNPGSQGQIVSTKILIILKTSGPSKKIQVPKGQIVSTKILIILKTSGLSKRFITNSGSQRTNSVYQNTNNT